MKRLLEGDGSEVERGLLDALRLERPSADLEQRMRVALGLGPVPAPVPAAPTAAAAPAAKSLGWGSVAAGSVVAALFVGGGVLLSRGEKAVDAPAPPEPAKIVPSEPMHEAPAPAALPESRADEPADEVPPKSRVQPTPRNGPSSQSLREEIRLIDAARMAVKKNDPGRALGILDQYSRRFPHGAFQEEARVLRAEAHKTP